MWQNMEKRTGGQVQSKVVQQKVVNNKVREHKEEGGGSANRLSR